VASLNRRGTQYWVAFYLNGQFVRKSLRTADERVTRTRLKQIRVRSGTGRIRAPEHPPPPPPRGPGEFLRVSAGQADVSSLPGRTESASEPFRPDHPVAPDSTGQPERPEASPEASGGPLRRPTPRRPVPRGYHPTGHRAVHRRPCRRRRLDKAVQAGPRRPCSEGHGRARRSGVPNRMGIRRAMEFLLGWHSTAGGPHTGLMERIGVGVRLPQDRAPGRLARRPCACSIEHNGYWR